MSMMGTDGPVAIRGASRRAEVRSPASGAAWLAEAQQCDDTTMLLRLQPGLLGALPVWPAGAAVDCMLDAGRHSLYAQAAVIRQEGERLWLRVPAQWLQTDRRASPRRLGGFAVRCRTEDSETSAACVDVSEGGMCLELGGAMPLRQALDLSFTLPGSQRPVWVRGLVAWACPAAAPGRQRVGVAFTSLDPETRARILEYCCSAVGA